MNGKWTNLLPGLQTFSLGSRLWQEIGMYFALFNDPDGNTILLSSDYMQQAAALCLERAESSCLPTKPD
jgi:hypothetical protein